MKAISIEGWERPTNLVTTGARPRLAWLPINDLIVDPSYQRPIDSVGRRVVLRITQSFSWSRFAPVVVAAVDSSKFAVIDGSRRTTAAALLGFETVPCQIVVADQQEQAAANKVLNGAIVPASRMAQHAVALSLNDECAIQLADICARADVKLLRYPVPVDRQSPGQTMAIGALMQCRQRYGEETLITALQCVTQTTNNLAGALSARMIKALCAVLDGDRKHRDSGLALLEAFDTIDLIALEKAASVEAAGRKMSPVQLLSEKIRSELIQRMLHKGSEVPSGPAAKKAHETPRSRLRTDRRSLFRKGAPY